MKQENSRCKSRRKAAWNQAARLRKLPTPVLSGSGSRVFLSPTSWSTPVSMTSFKHSQLEFASARSRSSSANADQGHGAKQNYFQKLARRKPGYSIVPCCVAIGILNSSLRVVTAVTDGILDSVSLKNNLGGFERHDAILSRC